MPHLPLPPLTFLSPEALTIAAAVLAIATATLALIRRPALPKLAIALLAAGAIALALAAGGLTWRSPRVGRVAVLVDVSPSTRTARYRERAQLESRIAQLLGRTRYTLYRMAETTVPAAREEVTIELSARRTVYSPPDDADIVLLFSDGRFAPPALAPPTYIIIDPELDDPKDAAVEKLEARGGNVVAATVNNRSGPRWLAMSERDVPPAPIAPGRVVVTRHVAPDVTDVSAVLRGHDPWPENNALRLALPPPPQLQRWWVSSAGEVAVGWRRLSASQLPTEPAEYLAASVIVLDNLAADDLVRRQRECIEQYVRDLGGGLVIGGGDRAFAAGAYAGSELERLSPLASTPPKPVNHWILLADSSGSMAAALGDNTRWAFAAAAMTRLLPLLPPDDSVSIGDFAESLRWWRSGRPVRELQSGFSPPRDIHPNGPTNLERALRRIAQTTDAALPAHLLLITDAQAKIDSPDALIAQLRNAHIAVRVLATEALAVGNPVRRIAEQTGGSVITESDPRRWIGGLRSLLRSAAPRNLVESSPLAVTFTTAGPPLPPRAVSPWNRTWLKSGATELASGREGDDASIPMLPAVAAWSIGNGAVIAAAFKADAGVISALAERVALPPRDPRFKVAWDPASRLTVTLDAADGNVHLNNLTPRLELFNSDTRSRQVTPIPQTAPGRYELSIPAPATPVFASVYVDAHPIDRLAVAGRYPPEFDQIGNDYAAMRELARSSGGEVIDPTRTTPIDFRWPVRRIDLTSYLTGGGAVLVALCLLRWRLR